MNSHLTPLYEERGTCHFPFTVERKGMGMSAIRYIKNLMIWHIIKGAFLQYSEKRIDHRFLLKYYHTSGLLNSHRTPLYEERGMHFSLFSLERRGMGISAIRGMSHA
ncbi:MAG: hypothetical protein ABIA75_08805 [Candidatus Neomarinimicrobiota bacterium]